MGIPVSSWTAPCKLRTAATISLNLGFGVRLLQWQKYNHYSTCCSKILANCHVILQLYLLLHFEKWWMASYCLCNRFIRFSNLLHNDCIPGSSITDLRKDGHPDFLSTPTFWKIFFIFHIHIFHIFKDLAKFSGPFKAFAKHAHLASKTS